MNTHVFVVDSKTFRYHLEYMFAGTGAKDKKSPFLYDAKARFHWSSERNQVSMIADISRVRKGDHILFYLQTEGARQGLFFGVFRAKSEAFFDENDKDNYLVLGLNKGLSFRILIEADEVFPRGLSEHECLDSLEGIEKPYQLCWSLIYRKLKGNRGCMMIMDYEYRFLYDKLKKKNKNVIKGKGYSFNPNTSCIETTAKSEPYRGRQDLLSIKERLLHKARLGQAFETHLQAFVMEEYEKSLREVFDIEPFADVWIGNEVYCGVGMQRIDVLLIQKAGRKVHIKVIELKDEPPYEGIIEEQLSWYVRWLLDFVVPNYEQQGMTVHVYPCIFAQDTADKRMIERIRKGQIVHQKTKAIVHATEYIAFKIQNKDIQFSKVQ